MRKWDAWDSKYKFPRSLSYRGVSNLLSHPSQVRIQREWLTKINYERTRLTDREAVLS